MSNISDFLASAPPDLGLMSVPALSPVASGDLVVFRESGGVSPYDPVIGPTVEANNTLGGKTMLAPSPAPGGGNYMTRTIGTSAALLSNGNVVTIYSGNGTAGTTNLNFQITNKAGAVVVPQTVVLAATSLIPHSVYATTTGFVILFGRTTSTLSIAVYTNNGVQVLASTNIITDAASYSGLDTYAGLLLANGNIAVAYRKVTSNDCVLKVFDQTGAQVGGTITVQASSAPTIQGMVQAPISGDIVLSYVNGSYAQYVARYTLVGAQVGSLLTFGGTGGSYFAGAPFSKHLLAVFDDDRIACIHSDSVSTSVPAITFISAANAVIMTVAAASLGSQALSTSCATIAADGNSLYFHQQLTGTTYRMGKWRSDGAGLVPPSTASCASLVSQSFGPSSTYGYMRLLSFGAAGWVVVFSCTDGSGNYAMQTLYIPADRNSTNTSIVTIYASTATEKSVSIALPVAPGVVYLAHTAGSTMSIPSAAVLAFPRSAIFGIAQASAVAGALVSVATRGTFTLPVAQQGGTSVNFDCRAYTPAGTKGVLAGASIVLLGLNG